MNGRAALVLLFLVTLSACATRKDAEFLRDRIDGVESMIAQQKTYVDGVDTALRKEYARLSTDFEKLAEQIRLIDGKADEKIYAVEKKIVSPDLLKTELDRVEAKYSELSKRYTELEKTLAGVKAELERNAQGKVETSADGKVVEPGKPLPPAAQLYDEALKLLEKNDIKGARDNLVLLMKEYPDFSHVDNAQFWIGETYYREKWYQKAILEYQKVIENYPKGGKVPAAYLKQGLAFFELKEPDNGRLILNQLIKKYPQSSEAATAKKKIGK